MNTSRTVRYLLVDDEALARQRLRRMVDDAQQHLDDVELLCVGEAESGQAALSLAAERRPNLIFLDIQMPGLNGFDVVEHLPDPRPSIVFVTAYDEYALQAFDHHALDYLTKPVRAERLLRCLDRVVSQQHLHQQSLALTALLQERSRQALQRLSVHDEGKIRILAVNDIERAEAEDKSVFVYIKGKAYRCDFRLDELEERLDSTQFFRLHRSHLVRLNAVRELIPWFSGSYCVKLDDGTQLPVARRRVASLRDALGRP